MTPDETAARIADIAARLDAAEAKAARIDGLQAQMNALSKRMDALSDYAGSTEYRVKQLKISTDARLNRLEDEAEK